MSLNVTYVFILSPSLRRVTEPPDGIPYEYIVANICSLVKFRHHTTITNDGFIHTRKKLCITTNLKLSLLHIINICVLPETHIHKLHRRILNAALVQFVPQLFKRIHIIAIEFGNTIDGVSIECATRYMMFLDRLYIVTIVSGDTA